MKKDVIKVLEEKRDQIAAGTEMIVAKTRDWQVIVAYMNNRFNEIDLTPEQQEKLKRYQYIHAELSSFKYTEQEVIIQVMNMFDVKIVQAYEDLNSTKEIFSKVLSIKKRFEQKMQYEAAKKVLHKCEELQDFKAYAAVHKNIVLLLRDIQEEEDNAGELFDGHTFEVVVDPRLIGAPKVDRKAVLYAINAKRSKKINASIFEDIDHEDVK